MHQDFVLLHIDISVNAHRCRHQCTWHRLRFLSFAVCGTLTANNIPKLQTLRESLLKHYDPAVRPVYNLSTPVRITVDAPLQQIIDIVKKLIEYLKYCHSRQISVVMNSIFNIGNYFLRHWLPSAFTILLQYFTLEYFSF